MGHHAIKLGAIFQAKKLPKRGTTFCAIPAFQSEKLNKINGQGPKSGKSLFKLGIMSAMIAHMIADMMMVAAAHRLASLKLVDAIVGSSCE